MFEADRYEFEAIANRDPLSHGNKHHVELGRYFNPPGCFPLSIGSYTMDTSRLHALTGNEYHQIVRYSSEAALTDSLSPAPAEISQAETVS